MKHLENEDVSSWGDGMWNVFAALATQQRTTAGAERTLERLDAEAEILDLFRRYHCFYDAGDIDGVISLFRRDCVVVNSRGTYEGHDAIRTNYEYLCGRRRFIIHYGTNVIIRFENEFDRAWLGAFWQAVVIPHEGAGDLAGGTYVNRVAREATGWQIFQQRITTNFRTTMTGASTSFALPPLPSHSLTSGDLIAASDVL